MPKVSLDQIEHYALRTLIEASATPANAAPVARSIRRAEADDMRPLGLGYLPIYLSHLGTGKVDGKAIPAVRQRAAAVVHVDAANGFAHPAIEAGFPALISAARACGTATMTVTRSYSAGALGHPAEDLADHGLVAWAVTNSPPNIAPWGGTRPLFGTSPMAFAVPRQGHPPLVIDQATSVVTKVALVAKAKAGERLPAGWAFDAQGQPTTDAQAALAGSLAPFGGAKGAALALMIDILAAGLTGANFSKDASPYARPEGPPPGVGQFFAAFDPNAFDNGFCTRIETLFESMLSQDGVRLPGDRRLSARDRIAHDGVEVDHKLFEIIGQLE